MTLPPGPPERIALRVAIQRYLYEYHGEGYSAENFLDYAKAHIERAKLLKVCVVCDGRLDYVRDGVKQTSCYGCSTKEDHEP